MQNLVPFEAYNSDNSGYQQRLTIVSGLVFGTPVAACVLFSLNTAHVSLITIFVLAPFVLLASGCLVGCFFSYRYRESMKRFYQEIYAGVGKFTIPPPTSDAYKYRLVCSWRKSHKLAVGGVLYLGNSDMIFVPHLANLPSDRKPFTIVYAQDLSLQLVPQQLEGLSKLLVPRPPELLQISSGRDSWLFLVPTPKQVQARIRQVTRAIVIDQLD